MTAANHRFQICLLVCAGGLAVAGCGQPGTNPIRSATDANAALAHFCGDCHNQAEYAGELAITELDAARVVQDPAAWEQVVRKLSTRTMPPAEARKPDSSTYAGLVSWLEQALDTSAIANPGRPLLRRLNRTAYGNAIRDLLDLNIDVSSLLPPDDSAFGFDNIGDLLVFSPTLLERYLSAADKVSALAVGDLETAPGAQTYVLSGDQSQATHLAGLPLGTVGGIGVEHIFPLDAEYEFAMTLFRNNLEVIRGLEDPHQLEISIDGERVFLANIGGAAEENRAGTTINELSDATDARLRIRIPVRAGQRHVTASFIRRIAEGTNRLRPFERSNAGTYDATGRPHLETLTITGPFAATGRGDTPSRERIFTCRPETPETETGCAQQILGALARRAYRRPPSAAELGTLMTFFAAGRDQRDFDAGIQLGLRRILASPAFAFQIEAEQEAGAPGQSFAISDFEFASRLALFLWSSIPDEELLELAERGDLADPQIRRAQVRRMLADPKAAALAENFAGQWLHLRNLANINPNSDAFPDFDNNLRVSLRREAKLFFASIVDEDRSVLDLMTAEYTFVDERLARHYGIPGVYGSHFRRIELGSEFAARRGLLGKGGILMATSHADRTAPSLRGKWLLENLLGAPPPPPPADVPALESEAPGEAPATMRARLESHRGNPACAGCHQLIDPLGFALENFDAVGGWRALEAGNVVDASGLLLDGTAVNGAIELREALLANQDVFLTALTEKLMIYALGRGLQAYDMPVIRGILRSASHENYRFSAIVQGIIDSEPFGHRATQAPQAAQ